MQKAVVVLACIFVGGLWTACDNSDTGNDGNSDSNADGDTGNDNEADNPFRPTELHEMADALAAAIDGKGDPSATEIAVVPNLLSAFWIPNQIGVGRASSEIGCLTVFAASPDGDIEEQIDILQDKVEEGFSGIAVSPIDPTEVETVISAAAENNINVITFDSDGVADSKRALYLGTINQAAGRQAGEKMVEVLDGVGKVAVFAGTFAEGNNASERLAGIEEAFANTDIELLVPYEDNVDFDVAKSNVLSAMDEHEDLSGIIGIWSYNGPKAAEAVLERDKEGDIKIVAFDLEPDTITYLNEGVIDAAVGQRPYWMGYLSVYILYAMEALGVDPTNEILDDWLEEGEVINTGTDIVTGDNLEDYRDYLESLGISSS